MNIDLEQARSLKALWKYKTFKLAADNLGKSHNALLYSIKTFEAECGFKLLDRSGYRSTFTPEGIRVLEACENVLEQESELKKICDEIKGGWEAELSIVYDGAFDNKSILGPLSKFQVERVPTKIRLNVAHLAEVENRFHRLNDAFMVAVLPLEDDRDLSSESLRPMTASLVAHKDHPLSNMDSKVSQEDVKNYSLITIKGSDSRLQLSTRGLDAFSNFFVNDFHTKRRAILEGFGYGWLPNYLISEDLVKGDLVPVDSDFENLHTFYPKLYWRKSAVIKKAGARFKKEFLKLAQ